MRKKAAKTQIEQQAKYLLSSEFTDGRLLKVAVIGVGGTGSEVMSGLLTLHQALVALGRKGLQVHAFDPDSVSQANLVRQRYHASDIGKNKAEVLIRRINAASGLNWQAHPETFDNLHNWDIVLSCVDTKKARAALHQLAFGNKRWKLWMDYGNEQNYGQVILGEVQRLGNAKEKLLPCATQIHPELIDTSKPETDTPSCSALDALNKQDLTVNKMVADFGMTLLWEALKSGQLRFHGYYFNLERGYATALPIPS